jgi:hypothetical protein
MSLAGVSLSVTTVRHARRDPRLAQAAVGVDAGVDQLDELADALGGAGAGERMDTAAIDLAEGVPAALAILVDRAQLGASDEPRLALDPGAVASGPVRRPVSTPGMRLVGGRG